MSVRLGKTKQSADAKASARGSPNSGPVKTASRIGGLERLELGAAPDNDLFPRQIEIEERFEVFFDRDPADVEEDGPLAEQANVAGTEQRGVDAPAPRHETLEAFARQFLHERWRCHHRRARSAMKPAFERIAEGLRHWQASGQIFRKARVIARGERPARSYARGPRRKADRAFRRDVDIVRLHRLDPASHLARCDESEADLRVGRHGNSSEVVRRDEHSLMAEPRKVPSKLRIGVHDAVDLRVPGVRRDQTAHQAAAAWFSAAASAISASRILSQRMISNLPSWVSPTAVPLSTQSPQLM